MASPAAQQIGSRSPEARAKWFKEWWAKNGNTPEAKARAARNRDNFRKNNPAAQQWTSYRKNAKSRGVVFELDRAHFIDLVTDSCYYCGEPPSPVNGVDRVNNSSGYVTDNVVTACRWCNQSKRAKTKEWFEAWACRVADKVRSVNHG